jgi:hypothetical protein
MSNIDLREEFSLGATTMEQVIVELPQVDAPVYHRFGPGIYIREVHVKAGAFIVGHKHRQEHANILLQGKVMLFGDDGGVTTLEAPFYFVAKAGRKSAYILEDMVWQNIYATDETNVDKLEEMFFEKTEFAVSYEAEKFAKECSEAEEARQDYELFLKEHSLTEEVVQDIMANLPTYDFNEPNTLRITQSAIQGVGMFTSAPIAKGTLICKAIDNGLRTPAARYINHSNKPNCGFVKLGESVYVQALTDISGCAGGNKGTELLVNYRDSLKVEV